MKAQNASIVLDIQFLAAVHIDGKKVLISNRPVET